MNKLRVSYRVVRSILFSLFLAVVALYGGLYLIISIPAVQTKIKNSLCEYASQYLGGNIEVEKFSLYPFNEIRLKNVKLFTPDGKNCIDIANLGAGISIWKLLSNGQIEITYAELIGLDAKLWQDSPDSKLNIQFIIDALANKDKNKTPSKFDLILHNIVIRRSWVSFDKKWISPVSDSRRFDFNHISLSDINADIALPRISNDNYVIDLRRLTMTEKSGFTVESLSFLATITNRDLSLRNLNIKLPSSNILSKDFEIKFNGLENIGNSLASNLNELSIYNSSVNPSDFAAFFPPLFALQHSYSLSCNIAGNSHDLIVDNLNIESDNGDFKMEVSGNAADYSNQKKIKINLENLKLYSGAASTDLILNTLSVPNGEIRRIVKLLSFIDLNCKGTFSQLNGLAEVEFSAKTAAGLVESSISAIKNANDLYILKGKLSGNDIRIGELISKNNIGLASINAEGNVNVGKNLLNGEISATIPYIEYSGHLLENISLNASKYDNAIDADINVDNNLLRLNASGNTILAGESSEWNVIANLVNANLSELGIVKENGIKNVSAQVQANIVGNSIENIVGNIQGRNLILNKQNGKSLRIEELDFTSTTCESGYMWHLSSDYVNATINSYAPIVGNLKNVATLVNNTLFEPNTNYLTLRPSELISNFDLNAIVLPKNDLFSFFNLPIKLLTAAELSGGYSDNEKGLNVFLKIPYFVQGKNKLIRNTTLNATINENKGVNGNLSSNIPLKKDRLTLNADIGGAHNEYLCHLGWKMDSSQENSGNINLAANIIDNRLLNNKEVRIKVDESKFGLAGENWTIHPAKILYSDNIISVDRLMIAHDSQFLVINGKASSSELDVVNVSLNSINLQYIFDLLNINYVNFGGIATGNAIAAGAFSKNPILKTESLNVRNFSYNEAVMGDAELESHWDGTENKVAINADIVEGSISDTKVRGGIYIKKDSLSFDFYTNHSNIACLQPFMSGFTSKVTGRASGPIKLYGTFADVDLRGRVHADTISLLVDQTNVTYSASDSVFFLPGKIVIPKMRLYDRFGNYGIFSGEVRHNFLKDANFEFDIKDARHLLVYDTDASIGNPWYGRIFANGNAALRGAPGFVSLDGTLVGAPGSTFTLELDEKEVASDYSFLTFTDKNKKEDKVEVSIEKSFEDSISHQYKQLISNQNAVFLMNLSLTLNPDVKIVLVMDPVAGDKITSTGEGAIRMQYDTNSDNFSIYGKYVINQGTYNFSLQDLILKNFHIVDGSSISFNGDPMQGILDIVAAYRVNTSIVDLDQAFANDPDLNRTSVPVDAMLHVSGEINTPTVKFNIDLPTMTPEVERKVRSIISTEEMMNIQVIYLLALNRFYTPEYTGAAQGGELASVASSTISSQISNIIGSLTDKFTLAPSFKSDRSDFSDLEFDVALSSSLFNNRLLINGNVGYRDKSTSLTTFVGDFDIEYLLNRRGSLRIKAYNHFNDASYYLKSALTTQGLGIIYRKDFDNASYIFRKRKKREKQ